MASEMPRWRAKKISNQSSDITLIRPNTILTYFANISRKFYKLVIVALLATMCILSFQAWRRAYEETIHPTARDLEQFPWLNFPRTYGYYNGLRSLVPASKYLPEYPSVDWDRVFQAAKASSEHQIELTEHNPYPDYSSSEYLSQYHPVETCYLDSEKSVPAPSIYSYSGIPQHQAEPVFGSYHLLGIRGDACFDRFGRFGPYGFGYQLAVGGSGEGIDTEGANKTSVWLQGGQINYLGINYPDGLDWAKAQTECNQRNRLRFESRNPADANESTLTKKTLPRTAVVIRSWVGFEWNEQAIVNFRAMINELSLKSGGEYTVHILLHVKDNSLPIWADAEVHQEVIRRNIPYELWGLVTLWSEKYMETFYSTPFGPPFENPSEEGIHGAYRSLHMPLQWFAHQHPEYDFFWNWEMDMRYTGHYWEFLDRLSRWGRDQPRKGLWERSAKYYIPALHGTWENFSRLVESENADSEEITMSGSNITHWPGRPLDFPGREMLDEEEPIPPLGCSVDLDGSVCGVGEEADLITFNPIFDPDSSGWVFSRDITGYDLSQPIPPRRTAIVTAGRLSKKLLTAMHDEMVIFGHSAFAEMYPPTIALHYGLKAVYAPHPVYFDRRWPLEEVERKFNGGTFGSTGGNGSSPYNQTNEHNHQGTTWYFNSGFSGMLWRRWLGYKDQEEGGRQFEEKGTGRMCLRGTLVHPIKWEHGSV